MNMLIQIWDTIVKSNFFNFVVMVLLLLWIAKKTNIMNILEKSKENIKTTIKNAELEKESAHNEFLNAQKSVENLEDDIKEKLQAAENRAETLVENISQQTKKKITALKENIEKTVIAEEKKISAKLSNKAAKASSELAKQHIKAVLNAHPELHEKYINQSIEELG